MPNRRLALAAAALAALAALAPRAASAQTTLRSADTHPDGYPTVEAVKYLSGLLEQRTNGRLKIQVYHSSQLGQEADTINQTRFGVIDMNRINLGPLNNLVPETAVPALPFIFRSVEHMRKVMDGPIGDEMLKALEPHGLIGLAFYDSGARSFYNSKRPVAKPEDMKGLKIRVQQSDLFIGLVNALGANPTPMPFGEVFSALQTGVIDGAENNWPSFESTRHFEVAKFYSRTEHSMSPEVLVMSKRAWDRLSAQDQATVRAAAKEDARALGGPRDGRRGRGEGQGRPDQSGRQAALHRRDEARLRALRDEPQAEGPRRPHPGDELAPASRGILVKEPSMPSLDALSRGLAWLSRLALWSAGAGLVLMTGVVAWGVFGRYVLNDTPVWAEPVALFLMSWFIIFGAAVGVREGDHLGFEVGLAHAPAGLARVLRLVTQLLVAGFGIAMVWYGTELSAGTWSAAMPVLGIPQGWDTVPIAAGGALIALFALERAWRLVAAGDLPPAPVDPEAAAAGLAPAPRET